MKFRTGQTLFSLVDATTVLVVKAPETDVVVTCGGIEMSTVRPEASLSTATGTLGLALGKRYEDPGQLVELLCVKPGTAAVAAEGLPLVVKEAKQLPASD